MARFSTVKLRLPPRAPAPAVADTAAVSDDVAFIVCQLDGVLSALAAVWTAENFVLSVW